MFVLKRNKITKFLEYSNLSVQKKNSVLDTKTLKTTTLLFLKKSLLVTFFYIIIKLKNLKKIF